MMPSIMSGSLIRATPPCGADVGRHPLERHHRDGAGVLGDLGLLGGDDVHDDAALEHLGHAALDAGGAGLGRCWSDMARFERAAAVHGSILRPLRCRCLLRRCSAAPRAASPAPPEAAARREQLVRLAVAWSGGCRRRGPARPRAVEPLAVAEQHRSRSRSCGCRLRRVAVDVDVLVVVRDAAELHEHVRRGDRPPGAVRCARRRRSGGRAARCAGRPVEAHRGRADQGAHRVRPARLRQRGLVADPAEADVADRRWPRPRGGDPAEVGAQVVRRGPVAVSRDTRRRPAAVASMHRRAAAAGDRSAGAAGGRQRGVAVLASSSGSLVADAADRADLGRCRWRRRRPAGSGRPRPARCTRCRRTRARSAAGRSPVSSILTTTTGAGRRPAQAGQRVVRRRRRRLAVSASGSVLGVGDGVGARRGLAAVGLGAAAWSRCRSSTPASSDQRRCTPSRRAQRRAASRAWPTSQSPRTDGDPTCPASRLPGSARRGHGVVDVEERRHGSAPGQAQQPGHPPAPQRHACRGRRRCRTGGRAPPGRAASVRSAEQRRAGAGRRCPAAPGRRSFSAAVAGAVVRRRGRRRPASSAARRAAVRARCPGARRARCSAAARRTSWASSADAGGVDPGVQAVQPGEGPAHPSEEDDVTTTAAIITSTGDQTRPSGLSERGRGVRDASGISPAPATAATTSRTRRGSAWPRTGQSYAATDLAAAPTSRCRRAGSSSSPASASASAPGVAGREQRAGPAAVEHPAERRRGRWPRSGRRPPSPPAG